MQTQETVFKEHPCFGGPKANKGRIHLPVSPGCNIECRFCQRRIEDRAQVPGTTSAVITSDDALDVIRESLERCPQIKVAGIAGPGDTLATPYALETFRKINSEFPALIKCMSTNGLLLAEKAKDVIDVGIETLTVTVNAVNPEIEAKLNRRIRYHGKIYEGVDGAKILIENQLEGIRKVSKRGVLVKVNTVLVPAINGNHIAEIARTVKEAGATLYNIIPLIPQCELKDQKAPTCDELDKARSDAEKYITIFRHCQHCRADAIGIPGVFDIGSQIYLKREMAKRKREEENKALLAQSAGLHLATAYYEEYLEQKNDSLKEKKLYGKDNLEKAKFALNFAVQTQSATFSHG